MVRISFSNLFKEFRSTATWLQFPFVCGAAEGSVRDRGAGTSRRGEERSRSGLGRRCQNKLLENKSSSEADPTPLRRVKGGGARAAGKPELPGGASPVPAAPSRGVRRQARRGPTGAVGLLPAPLPAPRRDFPSPISARRRRARREPLLVNALYPPALISHLLLRKVRVRSASSHLPFCRPPPQISREQPPPTCAGPAWCSTSAPSSPSTSAAVTAT